MARSSDFLLILVAILCPPVAVAFISGCSCDLLFSILLTLFGAIPGHIHAFWLIYLKLKAEEAYGYGGFVYRGNGTYEALPGQSLPPPPSYGSV